MVDWMGWQGELGALQRIDSEDPRSVPSPIASAAYAFVDPNAYHSASYVTTMYALETLERQVGSAKFMAAMKSYARTWAFKHPTGRDLYASLEASLGQDLSWYFAPVFQEIGGMALAVRSTSCRLAHEPRGVFGDGATKKVRTESEAPDTGAWVCEVVVTNTGAVHVPVDIDLRFADGSSQREHWDDRGHGAWERFVVEHSTKLVEVQLDPEGKLALDSPLAHRYRVEGDGSASLRAASRMASWTQTLLQVVGP
jgi:hypothetical protein